MEHSVLVWMEYLHCALPDIYLCTASFSCQTRYSWPVAPAWSSPWRCMPLACQENSEVHLVLEWKHFSHAESWVGEKSSFHCRSFYRWLTWVSRGMNKEEGDSEKTLIQMLAKQNGGIPPHFVADFFFLNLQQSHLPTTSAALSSSNFKLVKVF